MTFFYELHAKKRELKQKSTISIEIWKKRAREGEKHREIRQSFCVRSPKILRSLSFCCALYLQKLSHSNRWSVKLHIHTSIHVPSNFQRRKICNSVLIKLFFVFRFVSKSFKLNEKHEIEFSTYRNHHRWHEWCCGDGGHLLAKAIVC